MSCESLNPDNFNILVTTSGETSLEFVDVEEDDDDGGCNNSLIDHVELLR